MQRMILVCVAVFVGNVVQAAESREYGFPQLSRVYPQVFYNQPFTMSFTGQMSGGITYYRTPYGMSIGVSQVDIDQLRYVTPSGFPVGYCKKEGKLIAYYNQYGKCLGYSDDSPAEIHFYDADRQYLGRVNGGEISLISRK